MKKLFIIAAIVTMFASCKKTKDENPQPDFDPSEWADLGNTIFNDGGFGDPMDSTLTGPVDTLVHPHETYQAK